MAKTLLAYVFYGHDNDSYAFCEAAKCECGKVILNKWAHIPSVPFLTNHSMDVSSTYDGALIATEKVKILYLQHKWTGLDFRALPGEPGFYQVLAKDTFRFDTKLRKTRFEDKCQICGVYRQVAGSTPAFFVDAKEIPENGFACSDIEFGSNQEKHPIIVCSPSVGRILEAQKMKGLDLVKIFQK